MKMPARLSKIFQYFESTKTVKFFKSTAGLSFWERKRVWDSNRHISLMGASSGYDKNVKGIDMHLLYRIVGYADDSVLNDNSIRLEDIHPTLPYNTSYLDHVNKEISKYELAEHISIKEDPKKIYIAERNMYYEARYQVIVKDLVIPVNNRVGENNVLLDMFFCRLPSYSHNKPKLKNQNGIYLVFKNNLFIAENDTKVAKFLPREQAYLIFENNVFKSVDLLLITKDSSKVELENNLFIDSNVTIASDSSSGQDLVCLENNIFYRNDNISSELKINGNGCYFKGKNTVDNFILERDKNLNWSGYQNIDPQGNHAYPHQKIFKRLIAKAVENNDKIEETKLHRELLKCEKALISKDKSWRSLQDRFIFGWSSLISDYGISWFRPFSWLIIMNLFFASIVFYFFECKSSWWFLFFEFFNPISSLSDVADIKGSGWIAFINVAQKVILAAAYYEMIKIFRRFSK